LFSHHPGDPLPQNVVRNQVVRARWRTAADSVARINVARLAEVRVRIRSGEPAILSPEEP